MFLRHDRAFIFTYTASCELALVNRTLAVSSFASKNKGSFMFNKSVLALSCAAFMSLSGCISVESNFNRVATFPICAQAGVGCDSKAKSVAEIVAASKDGMRLVYTDSKQEQVGFVDISDPAEPKGLGALSVDGEPTSVAVKGNLALVAVNSSVNYVNTSGHLDVVDMNTLKRVRRIDLGGQPDSAAVSPDGRYAAIAIENERDEDYNDGVIPQMPAGSLVIVDLAADVESWSLRTVSMTGLADIAPSDPEPEYVDINSNNEVVVTLQENNHIVLVDLPSGNVTNHFSAGNVSLDGVDNKRQKPGLIDLSGSIKDVPREPDGVTWIDNERFVTADEGDYKGGSRGFTVFNRQGDVVHASGVDVEYKTLELGHYPEKRSGKKGNEPENADFGRFDDNDYLFVASERANLVLVYDVSNPAKPIFKQALPAGVAPEGIKTIPSRNLLIAASEKDDRKDGFRSALNIYQLQERKAQYPTLSSRLDAQGKPLPWGALSGLASNDNHVMFAVADGDYQKSAIYAIDLTSDVPSIQTIIRLNDKKDVIATLPAMDVDADGVKPNDVFDTKDREALVNDDKSVNLDLEGISIAADGGFWVVSEGKGTVGKKKKGVKSPNLLIKVRADGVIEKAITLPSDINAKQVSAGFKGVAEQGDNVVIVMQRALAGEDNPYLAIYSKANNAWRFVSYPLENIEVNNNGWLGLSAITALDNGQFLVVERDNQAGVDARFKRLYKIDISGARNGDTLSKVLVKDLMPELKKPNGAVVGKVDGLVKLANGDVYIVNDNDAVDDNNGETQLINIGKM